MKKFIINAIHSGFITLSSEDGLELSIGYKKNVLKFAELRTKAVGDAVMLRTETSPEGRLYLAENDAIQFKLLEAREYNLKLRRITAEEAL